MFIWNVAPVVCIAATAGTVGLVFEFPANAGLIDILDIIHPFDHDNSSSVLQLIVGKLRNLQKLLKYFNGTTTSTATLMYYYPF